MNTIEKFKDKDFFKFSLGSLELLVVSDGEFDLDPIQPLFAPGIDAEKIVDFLESRDHPSHKLIFEGNILVVKNKEQIILIDTGSGKASGTSVGKIVGNLAAAGIQKEDITDIVLTHAHHDHIGGIMDDQEEFTFPNAQIYIAKKEYDFWTSDQPDFSKGSNNEMADFQINFAKKHIGFAESKLHFFDNDDELFGFLRLHIAPGHTPGHTVITIFSEGEELVHFADIFQHVLLLGRPEWGNQVDVNFDLAVQARQKFGSKWSESKAFTFGDHLPFPGLGYIEEKDGVLHWIPKEF
ncbi:glyoxylase-like metal-dependent hydrolase (beta-lactamase superfamily II) [Chryseobacterium sediminis]|uniref:Glyoxylase-like metal-dependent hydrolase (Beta-lactamase superfamily II) n=1 Tax=Chryseobacterium sediminis TaxID=1679494 RepID=A0ABR6PWF2_9FLAO|nr:MBL fold metallo-hydrolase [Chryseobacterium sediminis]MBB6330015.1 glyoxylase-like metal-dependent hydrolase (beta-lactamase superfamily II) [Chryseobacterium sediminis]